MSKRRSDTRCARFFPVLTALLFAFFFLCPVGTYADEAATFPVTYELTHLTADGPDEVTAGEDFTVTLTPDEGYALPDEIEVYVDGELLTAGEDYSYDPYGYLDDEDWDEDEGADEDDFGDEDDELDDEDDSGDEDDEFGDEEDFGDEDDDFDDEGDEVGDEVDESDGEDDSDEVEDTADEGDVEDENDGFDDGEDSGDADGLDDEDLDAEDDEFGSEDDFGSADDTGDEDESNDEDDELNAEDESDSEDLDEENRDDEEDPNDEGDEFDDEDDEFDDEDWDEVDYDDSTALTIYGEHVTGPVLIRACADELEYASSDVSFDDYMAKGTTYADTEPPLSAPPAPASADEKDRSPATGDDDISGAAFILLGTSLLTLIILQRKRATR